MYDLKSFFRFLIIAIVAAIASYIVAQVIPPPPPALSAINFNDFPLIAVAE